MNDKQITLGKKLLKICRTEEEFVEIHKLMIEVMSELVSKVSIGLKSMIDEMLDDEGAVEFAVARSREIWRKEHA